MELCSCTLHEPKKSSAYTFSTSQLSVHRDLKRSLEKHCESRYLRPIADHQRVAFELATHMLAAKDLPIILDSGCGTGLSTVMLAKQFPDHFVLGVDRSSVRLHQFAFWQKEENAQNCAVIQANLEDFWRLLDGSTLKIAKHFLLYPNPYPKIGDLGKRWHGHPVFSTLAKLSPYLELRCNWKIYADEFSFALGWIKNVPIAPTPYLPAIPISSFEKKYCSTGTTLFRVQWSE